MLISLIILLSFLPAQASQFGFSAGTGVYSGEYNYFYSAGAPQHLNLHFYQALSPVLTFGISAGYGYHNSVSKNKIQSMTSYYYATEENTISGFPVEIELLMSKQLSESSHFKIFAGLGAGYYSYQGREKYSSGLYYEDNEVTIKGLAQYYTFGLEFNLNERNTAFLQFKKLGLSGITAKENSEDDSEETVKPMPGTYDLGIAVGIKYSF